LSPRANFGRGLAWLGRHPSTKACPRAHARARCRKSRYTSAMVAAKQRGRISAGRSLHQTDLVPNTPVSLGRSTARIKIEFSFLN
jgi:hypothetical protein